MSIDWIFSDSMYIMESEFNVFSSTVDHIQFLILFSAVNELSAEQLDAGVQSSIRSAITTFW